MAKIVVYAVLCDTTDCEERVESDLSLYDSVAEAERLFWQIDNKHGIGIGDRCPTHTEMEV